MSHQTRSKLQQAIRPSSQLLGLAALSLLIQLTAQLRFSTIKMPALVQRGSNFWLACQAQLDPGDQLYSVKWYKDNQEFHRALTEAQPEQQSFGLPGLNVLMSSSNATHVRLLNASLESEGIYACEISSQNLSTIRYEREIRVYVLASSKLRLIGFRARYSLGDQVDIQCQADYSRPKPALGWFVNGQHVAKSSRWFQVSQSDVERQLEIGARLVSSSLGLKFKLTSSLLGAISESNQRGNQSRAPSAASSPTAPAYSYQSDWPLRIQCKYKLTEVSDVTFNELQLGPADLNRNLESVIQSTSARLVKTADNEVAQTPNPASRPELERLLTLAANQSNSDTCQLELQLDDPLIVATNDITRDRPGVPVADDPDNQWIAGERRRRQLIAKDPLELDCLTLSKLRAPHRALTCDQAHIRRRTLISGLPEERNSTQTLPGRQRPLVSYLSLGAASLVSQADRDGPLASDGVVAPARHTRADSTPLDWLAPPLLEWFINNQEAPANSKLLGNQSTQADGEEPPDGATHARLDYTQHFANFHGRPIEQSLALKFQPDLSTDTNTRLRCSSTQAQVLAFDSIALAIVPVSSSGWTPQRARTNHVPVASGRRQQQLGAGAKSSQSRRGTSSACASISDLYGHFRLRLASLLVALLGSLLAANL